MFNQQLDGMEIKGKVPWQHPSKYWRDADDAQLVSYIDTHYGTFSQRNYQIAVTKVADDRSYHPIVKQNCTETFTDNPNDTMEQLLRSRRKG